MFFIGIFGIESKSKEIKILENLQCKKCNLKTRCNLIKTFDCFHFFFIPLFKWNESYYVVCNRCNSVYEIPKEKGKAIERGENVDVTYWDLKEIKREYNNNYYQYEKRCPNCGKVIEGDFKYCPYCGEKIN